MEKLIRTGLLLACVLGAMTARVHANNDDEAKTHFKNAAELYDENNFRGALVEFKRAYELSPSPKILFNIAQVEMELQDFAEAYKAYSRYLREGGPDVPADRVTQVNGEIERLKGRIGFIAVQTAGGAEVLIDDVSAGFAPLPDAVPVNTGHRTITVKIQGQAPETRSIDVAGRQTQTVVIGDDGSSKPGGGGGSGKHSAPEPIVKHPVQSKLLIGGGAVFLAGGLALTILEMNKVPSNCSISSGHCLGPPGDPSLKTAGDAMKMADIGIVLSGLGAAAVIGGVIWYVQGRTEEQPKFTAAPWVTSGGGGLALTGSL